MRQKLISLIEAGSDIEFSYNGVMYTILPWTDDGITIGAQGVDNDATFPDAAALLQGYRIDGMPLEDVLPSIHLEFTG